MTIAHQLVGYDIRTERLSVAMTVPAHKFKAAAEIAGVPEEDAEAIGSYPLEEEQAERIARLIGQHVASRALAYFLEPLPNDD